jgi:hypothetical protein
MPVRPARRFTLFDAIILIAATAVAFVPMRYFYSDLATSGTSIDWSVGSIFEIVMLSMVFVAPLALTWSVALWIARLRQPRPRLSRAFRQPGMVACSAIIIVALFKLINVMTLVALSYDTDGIPLRELPNWFMTPEAWLRYVDASAISVAAAWIVLRLGKAGRPEPSWIDRTGRILGGCCVIFAILFGWIGLGL